MAIGEILIGYLDASRARVLAVVDGLDPTQLLTPVLPSASTPLGMIEHLGLPERHWFRQVSLCAADPLA